MAMKGDFIGFKFAGTHSEELGILRVSDGNRYNDEIIPDIQDITTSVPGKDGEYYFGSSYGPKHFTIQIAFDSITEVQLRKIKRIFSAKNQGELIFDEYPYKKYIAKIDSPIKLSYVCFDEPIKTIDEQQNGIRISNRYGEANLTNDSNAVIDNKDSEKITVISNLVNLRKNNASVISTTREYEQIFPYKTTTDTQRIYKGEGEISFIAYFPFAKSCFKVLKTEDLNEQWASSTNILSELEHTMYLIDRYNQGKINIYNSGDLSTGFQLYCPFYNIHISNMGEENTFEDIENFSYDELSLSYIEPNSQEHKQLIINNLEKQGNDIGFIINTNTNLISGITEIYKDLNDNIVYKTSNNLYNQYIKSGDFFKLEPNEYLDFTTMNINGGNNYMQIFYDYLYF